MFKYVSVIEKVICLIYIIFAINSCTIVAVFTPAIATCRNTTQTGFSTWTNIFSACIFWCELALAANEIQQVLWSRFFICSIIGTRAPFSTRKLWKHAARSVGGNDCGLMVFVAPADISKYVEISQRDQGKHICNCFLHVPRSLRYWTWFTNLITNNLTPAAPICSDVNQTSPNSPQICLIRVCNYLKRHTAFKDFNLIISNAFNQSGWSNVRESLYWVLLLDLS